MFDQIELVLPALTTFTEIQPLARMAASLLHSHGENEQNLFYDVLDHMLKEKGYFGRIFAEHRETDSLMNQVQQSVDLAKARQLFQDTIDLTREHFLFEEQTVFPLAEKHLQNESLETLGALWKHRHANRPMTSL